MSLLIVSFCAILIYFVIHKWLLPSVQRRTFQSKFAEMTKIGWLAALAFARRFVLIAAATFGGLWLITKVLSLLFTAFPDTEWMHEFILNNIVKLNSFLELISVSKVVVFFLLLSIILVILVVRKAKSLANSEFILLKQMAENGQLPELDPSKEMLEETEKLGLIQKEYFRVLDMPEDAMDDTEKKKKNDFLTLVLQVIPKLENNIKELDIRRRLLPAIAAKSIETPIKNNSWLDRFANVFTSQGMVNTISRTSGTLATIGLVLLLFSFIAASKGLVISSTEDFSKQISALQLQNKSKKLNEEWSNSLLQKVPKPDQPKLEWNQEDEEILDGIAREFELAISNSLGQGVGTISRALEFTKKVNAIRENIINIYAYRPDGTLKKGYKVVSQGQYLTDLALDGRAAKEFSQKYASQGLGNKPQTEGGIRFKEKLRNQLQSLPNEKEAWELIKKKYTSSLASFKTTATPRQVAGMMLDQVLTGVIDINNESFTSNFSLRLAKKAGGQTFKFWLDYKMNQFSKDLISEASLSKAIKNAGSITCAADRFVNYAVKDVDFPSLEGLDNSLKDYRPALEFDEFDSRKPSVQSAFNKFVNSVESSNKSVFAESVSDYTYHFPGQAGAQSASMAAEIVETVGKFIPKSGGGNSQRLAKSSVPALRARNFHALRGFRRIGGVLLGRESNNPENQFDFSNITWIPTDNDYLEILIHRKDGKVISAGTYQKDVVHQALAYVADGRLITATMISAKPMPYFKILLHPTLINTDLGCRAINVDRFVDKYAREDKRVAKELEAYKIQESLYRYASFKMAINGYKSSKPAELLTQLTQYEAAIEQQWSEIYKILEGGAIFSFPDRSHIAAKPNYYSSEVISKLTSCLKNCRGSYQIFLELISQQIVNIESISDIQTEEWSGVREMPYKVDADLSFLYPEPGQNPNLFPLNFIRQIIFMPNSSSYEDGNSVEEVDENPWEFPYLKQTNVIDELVWKGIKSDPADRLVFERMRDFTKLQRLFRVAVSGQLGFDFPVEKLHQLMILTRSSVKEVETPTWNYNYYSELFMLSNFQTEKEKNAYMELSKALGTTEKRNLDPCK